MKIINSTLINISIRDQTAPVMACHHELMSSLWVIGDRYSYTSKYSMAHSDTNSKPIVSKYQQVHTHTYCLLTNIYQNLLSFSQPTAELRSVLLDDKTINYRSTCKLQSQLLNAFLRFMNVLLFALIYIYVCLE